MTPHDASAAFLARLAKAHPERRDPLPITVRYRGEDGTLRFAAILDRDGERVAVRDFATGSSHWIDRADIMEAA